MDINPDYLSIPETETPELVEAECKTFEAAQKVFDKITSEYRIALVIETDKDSDAGDETNISKAGGLPLFPIDMDWPICEKCGEKMSLRYQIRKQDAPALATPTGMDILQLFMCPENCGDEQPEHEIIWHKENDITEPLLIARGRDLKGKQVHFRPFRDHMTCDEYNNEGYEFYNSNLFDCEVRFSVRMIARMMEGIADDSLDERLKHYGDNPLAQLESMNNESVDFFESMQMYHIEEEKIGGYPSWVQDAALCHGSYMNILQIKWAEGFWHIVVCPECGDYHTEYQGS